MYDLRRLRAFHAVAERRSFSAAALDLGYAQSVVSHHVAALEDEFGLSLVDRSTRPVRLTPAGERLRGHAVAVLGAVAQAEDELRALAGLQTGTLRVGAFLTACTSFVPPALARFERDAPAVEVRVEQVETEDALRRLRAGDLDLAVVYSNEPATAPPGADASLGWRHLGDDPYRLVLPSAHRLARTRRIHAADLAAERFSAPVREGLGLVYHEMLERVCGGGGFEPDIAYVVRDVTVGRALVSAGLCIAVMPELTMPVPRSDVAVRPLPAGVDEHRTVFAVWLRNRRVPAVAPMLRLLAEAAGQRLAPVGSSDT
ncbi:MAG TPA: LysR family transcriptional regulator [Solirubrobacteraceae bacterium]|nr:LysR family transcriptional regulator [Solirubrobacteraceae bacterium]